MFVVKNNKGEVVALCTKLEDAIGIAKTKLDKDGPYKVEKQ